MKIVFDNAIPFIHNRLPEEVKQVYLPGNEITAASVEDADALIVRTRTKCNESLLKNSGVKLVATATIGTDHIDIPWCERNGIVIKSAPGCNAPGVAQYVFSSLFKTGFDPNKDTLGIIGYGNVGSIVAQWGREMGVNVIVNDPPRENRVLKDIEYRSIEEVLKNCDAVTIHVPFSKEGEHPTFNLIGEKELDMLKPGAILINSSRGGVVDENYLKRILREGKIKTVIDVWENEPDVDPELVELATISTPHIAGYSAEGKMRATRMVLEAMKEVLGIPIDISGLECIPKQELKITKELIAKSYNPEADSERMKKNYPEFEKMRNCYDYRHEPFFI